MGLERFIGYEYTIKYRNPKDSFCLGYPFPADCQGVKWGKISSEHEMVCLLAGSKYMEVLSLLAADKSEESDKYVFKHTRFNVGDILIGNEINHYGVTNSKTLVRVLSNNINHMDVEIVDSLSYPSLVGEITTVQRIYFRIATPEDFEKFHYREA